MEQAIEKEKMTMVYVRTQACHKQHIDRTKGTVRTAAVGSKEGGDQFQGQGS